MRNRPGRRLIVVGPSWAQREDLAARWNCQKWFGEESSQDTHSPLAHKMKWKTRINYTAKWMHLNVLALHNFLRVRKLCFPGVTFGNCVGPETFQWDVITYLLLRETLVQHISLQEYIPNSSCLIMCKLCKRKFYFHICIPCPEEQITAENQLTYSIFSFVSAVFPPILSIARFGESSGGGLCNPHYCQHK